MSASASGPLRVLHVAATNQRRGGETYAADLVAGLARLGVEQRIAVLRRARDGELRFHAPAGVVGGGPRLPVLGIDLRAVRRVRRLVGRFRPDVIHAHGGESFKHAAVAAGPSGPALVYGRIGAAWIGSGARVLGYRVLMRRADRVFALAEALSAETVEVFGVPPERVLTMAGGVDESFIRPRRGGDAVRQELAIPAGAPVVLGLGALVSEKDPLGQLSVAAEALEKVPHAVYVVAGEGPLRPEVEAAVGELGLGSRVRVLGARPDVGDLLAAADVLLLASRHEGVPRVVLEAGMAGLPAVAYAVAGIPETVVDGDTGLLAPAGDAGALAVALAGLLADPELRRDLGARARRLYRERFSVDAVARAYLEVYRDLVRAR